MYEMEEQLSSILSNPQLMQQIMHMAQSLGQQPDPAPPRQDPPGAYAPMADIDPVMIGKIMGIAGKSSIDDNQRALLCALQPYLSSNRLQKLEKAMRAAKLAGVAAELLQSSKLPFLSGR